MKSLSTLCYQQLRKSFQNTGLPSGYYLTAISKASGILASRKKSIRRGIFTKCPYLKNPLLVSCYDFKIVNNDKLQVSLRHGKKISLPLTKHVAMILSEKDIEVRSITVTPSVLSLSIRKKVEYYKPKTLIGIDRNASNLTCGNSTRSVQFNLKKVEEIAKVTREIIKSFKRNDFRIGRILAAKYGKRRSERVKQILHHVTKTIVFDLKQKEASPVIENITGLRNLYRKGNFQGKNFRARMNSVPWFEIKRQIEYKAAWNGVPVIQLSKEETRGTSKSCPACGERLQEDRYSRVHRRELWCGKCGKWRDRDLVAVMNISRKGWLRFGQSSAKGEADEAMVQEPRKEGILLKVDASKLRICRVPTITANDKELTEPKGKAIQ